MLLHGRCVDMSRFQLYKKLYAADVTVDLASCHQWHIFCSFQNLSVGLDIVLEDTRSLASILNSLLSVYTTSLSKRVSRKSNLGSKKVTEQMKVKCSHQKFYTFY